MSKPNFWIVWNPDGDNPTYRHPTEELAFAEAARLALTCPGHSFIVLRAVSQFDVTQLSEDDMPF